MPRVEVEPSAEGPTWVKHALGGVCDCCRGDSTGESVGVLTTVSDCDADVLEAPYVTDLQTDKGPGGDLALERCRGLWSHDCGW